MLSEYLNKEMQERGLSVRQAALQIGVSHSTIFRVLKGDSFDVPTLVAISNWLNVRPSTLLDNLGKSNTIDQVALLVESNPGILDVLAEAVEAINKKEADPAIIEDIVAYASYKLSLQKGRHDSIDKKGAEAIGES